MEAAVETETKLELKPQLGLANIQPGTLPMLQLVVKNKKGQMLSSIKCRITALCVNPHEHNILYCECCSTSSSSAHAFMAATVEGENTVQTWAVCMPGEDIYRGHAINAPSEMRVADVKLALKGHTGLHHFALLAKDAGFIIANDQTQLWMKLRKVMSCPTKEEWGKVLLPRVLDAGALIPCESFGLPEGMCVFVLELDAEAQFDSIVSQWVKENGLG